MTVPNRMLWVDDKISKYVPWITRFGDFGTKVDPANSLEDGLRLLEENDYDVVLLDLMMEHDSCINMLPIVYDKAKNANLFVCSGFLYLPEIVKQLGQHRDSELRFGQIDKTTLPFTDDSDAIVQFLEELKLGASEEYGSHTSGTDLIVLGDHESSAADKALGSIGFPTWAGYSELDARAKMDALRAAADLTRDLRKQFELQGFRYLLFCGSWTQPVLKLRSIDDAPSQEDVVSKARVLGYAPFAFSVGGRIDDCSDKSGLLGYPSLRLTYHGTSEAIHFDSGNTYTLLSYEWYTQKGWLPTSFFFDIYGVGEMELFGNLFTLDNTIVADAAGATKTVTLKGFAVTGWDATRLATQCQADCTEFASCHQYKGNCKYRTGLLGRNLPQAMDTPLTIDFATGKTYFA